MESINQKIHFATLVNREENDRIKDIINLNKQELNIYKDIFQVNYNDFDLRNFKEARNQRDEERDKHSLIKVAETLLRNPENLKSLSPENKAELEILLAKYGVKIDQYQPELFKETSGQEETKEDKEDRDYNEDRDYKEEKEDEPEKQQPSDEGHYYTQPQESQKIEFSDDEEDQNKNANANVIEATEELPKGEYVVTNAPKDKLDHRLNSFLGELYAKKRVSIIPFRRISHGNYEFGTQKVMVKVENEKIKIRVGGGYLLLDKFIEVQAPIEEAKLMEAKNVTNKFGRNVCVKKVTGGKAIYALEQPKKTPDRKLVF